MKKENFVYSAKDNAIYPVELKHLYVDAKSWPKDGVFISNELAEEFRKSYSDKIMVADNNGYPKWESVSPYTKEQFIESADYEKQSLITEANQKTQLWQTQLMLDIITDEDKASLTEWMLYVQKVQAVDTSTAPDILWPEKPE